MTAELAIKRCIDARLAQLVARVELLKVSDAPEEGRQIALAAVHDETEFLLPVHREWVQTLELEAIANGWSLK